MHGRASARFSVRQRKTASYLLTRGEHLQTNPADQVFPKTMRTHARPNRQHARNASASRSAANRAARPPMPSTYGYMTPAGLTAARLFFVLSWMLHGSGDKAPLIPA